MTTLDPIALAGAKAKGKRPQYFDDPAVERVLNIAMAVAMELAVARERIDSIERLLEKKGLLRREEIEGFIPDRAQAEQRAAWTQEYLARILRIVQQELEAISENAADNRSLDDVVEAMRRS
jgi:hypothetical protein